MLQSLANSLRQTTYKTRQLQFDMDTYQLFLLLSYRAGFGHVDDIIEEANKMKPEMRANRVGEMARGQAVSLLERQLKQDEKPFTTVLGPSKIAGAGKGVLIKGHAPVGSLLTFFPGKIYSPSELQSNKELAKNLVGNEFTFMRPDSTVIDAKEYSQIDDIVWTRMAHFVNHPPKDKKPNVMSCSFEFFPLTLPESIAKQIPNTSCNQGEKMSEMKIPALGLVCLCEIEEGTELLLDYRYNPNLKNRWPEWYHPVPGGADERRWSVK